VTSLCQWPVLALELVYHILIMMIRSGGYVTLRLATSIWVHAIRSNWELVFTLYRRLLSPTVTYHHSCDLPGAGYTHCDTIEKERKKRVRELHVLSFPMRPVAVLRLT